MGLIMKKYFFATALVAATAMSSSAFAQDTCDAKKMSFTEFTACAEAALVKDTQGMCISGSKCFDGQAEAIVSSDDVETGSGMVGEVLTGSTTAVVSETPIASEIMAVERVTETVPEKTETSPVIYAEVKPIAPVQTGYEARVLFALGSAELLNASNSELDEIASVMMSKPHLGLQIQGHASADGDEFYNLSLSSKRAEAVRNALLSRGVSIDRLSHKGYGEYQLKDTENPNSSENRRVEMVLDFSIN